MTMKKSPLRRYAAGALTLGALAGGAAAAGMHAGEAAWRPAKYNLTASPAQLLPVNVSTDSPVRVVSTALDRSGRPVVTTRTATTKKTAADEIRAAQNVKNAVGVEIDARMTALQATAPTTGADPMRAQQWDFAKINAQKAWQKSTGANVVVAVIDTGVDATHPDLKGQVLAEYDVINSTTNATSSDENGHGTHVAGTIAADAGNEIGISGIAPHAKILPIRVLDKDGSGYMSDAATGIIYAADHGATVINMSLGSPEKVTAVTNAIAYARGKGVTVIAAAGNDRQAGSPTSYPAADPGVIAVSATDENDRIADYSNAGAYVDVAAPGSDILSTTKGTYQSWNGTSMASPHVAAIAALLESSHRALTPDQIEKAIENSAVDLGAKGKDNDFGYGRVDAAAALAATPVPPASKTAGASPSASKATSATPRPSVSTTTSRSPSKTASPSPSKTASPGPSVSKTTGAVPSPSVTRTGTKTKPVVTVSTTGQTITYGTTTTTTFTVTAAGKPVKGEPVQIAITPAGGSTQLTTSTTSATGTVTVLRAATGSFSVSITVAAGDTTEAVTSPSATWTAKAAISLTRDGGTASAVVTGGASQKATLQRLDGTTWTPVGTYTATTRFTMSNLTGGKSYRIVIADTAAINGTTSNTI
jgi:type VII secretion-associated serine protease mycosin